MSLESQEHLLVERRIARDAPDPRVVLGLALAAGWLGAHRLYLGRRGSGLAMLALGLAGLVAWPLTGGWGLAPVLLWVAADLARLPGQMAEDRRALRAALSGEWALGIAAADAPPGSRLHPP